MAAFPIDVITDIFCRLPVKTLVRFKCVSKPWGSLIDDSDFASLHLHHSFKGNTNARLLLEDNIGDDDKAYSVDLDTLGNLVQLPHPFTVGTTEYYARIFGSCNGLIAVYHTEAGIALWNPSTRKCHYLPASSDDHDMSADGEPVLGFGYDVIGNDYKVVKMMACGIAMLYSLKANSWRRIKGCPYDLPCCIRQRCAYVNGSLHWVGRQKGERLGGNLIFALDLGVEEYYEVPAREVHNRDFVYMNVVVLG